MVAGAEKHRVLLVDDESDIREIIAFTLESAFPVELVEASSGNQAIEIIKKGPQFSCVISDYYMPNGTGGDLFRYVKGFHPKLPFVLCTAAANLSDPGFKLGKLDGLVEKPAIVAPLKQLLSRILEVGDKVASATPTEYSRVKMKTLLRIGKIQCELFVRLGDGKFVRVTRAGEEFAKTDFDRFDRKSLEFLFVRNTDAPVIYAALEKSIRAVAGLQATHIESIMEVSRSTHEAVHELTQKLGFTSEALELTQASVKLAVQGIRENPKIRDLFERLKISDDNYISGHSVVVAYASGGIAALLGFTSESVHQKLACAAFLHDLKVSNQKLARFQTLEQVRASGQKFPEADLDEFQKHPTAAADLARESEGLPPEVDTIIEQHHERPLGDGFPAGLTGSLIHPLAAIFIVAHDLVDFANRGTKGPSIPDFVAEYHTKYQEGPFLELLKRIPKLA